MTVPLHIFEERYRSLVHHLLSLPDNAGRLFGIVAIREGYEVALGSPDHRRSHQERSLYCTGCVVQLTTTEEYDDGRFDIATVGRHRFRVLAVDSQGPFLRAEVEHLDDAQEL